MNLQDLPASGNSVTAANDNFETLDWASVYGKDQTTTTALTWGYLGGRWGGFAITASTLTLTNSVGSPTTYNYIVVLRSTGVISVSTTDTNWNNTAAYARVYKVLAVASLVTEVEDHRAGPYGVHGGKVGLEWNQETDSYTLALTDAENGVAMNKASANNLTVPPNSTVAFPIGTSILVYQEGAGQTTIVPGSGVTVRCSNQVGSPLPALALSAQYALATLVKRGTNEWILSGDLVSE